MNDGPRAGGNAFLLAQLGAYAAQRFADRIAELGLSPPQTGLLRVVAMRPGQSQQAIANQLGTPPSRLVALVDGLEQRNLIERRRNPDDRRHHALYLTDEGVRFMAQLAVIGKEHEDAMCAGLEPAERGQLLGLLSRIAVEQGLTPMVHPGYRAMAEQPD
jgi:DNA-binding MarR family transcriptional regulator